MTRPRLAARDAYDPRTVDKVERLLELLGALRTNAYLRPRLVLHGGTALNLFQLPRPPRLSVDIDLMYVGSAERDVMLAERDEVVSQLLGEARLLGFYPSPPRAPRDEHAGVTTRLAYRGEYRDSIKVDLNFHDRVPLLGWVEIPARHTDTHQPCRCLEAGELLARKVAAIVSRVEVRDLYDLAHVAPQNDPLGRATVTYHYSLADTFPQRALGSGALERFAGREAEVESRLYPLLAEADRPTLEEMVERVGRLLDVHGRLDDAQREYLRLLGEECEYRPELLFGEWPDVLTAAKASPRMRRKIENLRRR